MFHHVFIFPSNSNKYTYRCGTYGHNLVTPLADPTLNTRNEVNPLSYAANNVITYYHLHVQAVSLE